MVGQTISHYRVLERVGAGGMGVVYKAEDTKLGRLVALKFLPEEFSRDRKALERLQREARTASSLDHPNICTIYEIGEHEGRSFISMQFLEGCSLRQLISARPVELDQLLEWGIQIADALDAAHAKGVVHRDIKPANIFITPRGHAKILDFGLAKLLPERLSGVERLAASAMPTAGSAEEHLTSPGVAIGTLSYMSPEQARGKELDARTDLFSFGAVLYEMATGTLPFRGRSSAEIFDAILNRAPTSPVRLNPELPAKLEEIIHKALEKDRDLRYQSAAELRADLKRVKRDTESTRISAVEMPAAVSRKPWLLYTGIVAGVVVMVLAALLAFRATKSKAPGRQDWVPLTNFTDSATSPALSADGRMLTFIRGPSSFAGPGQVYVKMLPDGEPFQLTRDDFNKMSPIFSPDGSRIAYTVVTPNLSWDTWVVPVLGGEPRLTWPNASGMTWLDSHHLMFSEIKKGIHMALVTASEDRSEARNIYLPPHERGMAHRSYLSPDGKWVLLAEMDNVGWQPCRVVPFDGSSTGRQVGPPGAGCTIGAWSPDGSWVYLNSNAGGAFHIWRQRFPDGEPEQLTSGPTQETGVAVAPDGNSIVTTVGNWQGSVWIHDAQGDRQISSEGYGFLPDFWNGTPSVFSPDGNKMYYLVGGSASRAFRSGELWAVELNSGRSERVLSGYSITSYTLSRDGKRLAFAAVDANNKSHIWLGSLERRFPPRDLAEGDAPMFGPEKTVYFRSADGKYNFIYQVNEDGSRLQKLISTPIIFLHDVSPDGQWVIADSAVSEEDTSAAVFAYSTTGGASARLCSICGERWSPDGKFFSIWLLGTMADRAAKRGTFVFQLRPGESFPPLSPSGFKSETELAKLAPVRIMDRQGMYPGPSPSVYAYTKTTVQNNLYRIPVP
jgi:Tol biopolymer transport system component/predicted Ser/Thr protein kinase